MPKLNTPTDNAMVAQSSSTGVLKHLAFALVLISLAGCGQKGPLVLPQERGVQVQETQAPTKQVDNSKTQSH